MRFFAIIVRSTINCLFLSFFSVFQSFPDYACTADFAHHIGTLCRISDCKTGRVR